MGQKGKVAAVIAIIASLVLGILVTTSYSKFSEQEEVNLIFACSSGTALEAGSSKFKELCEEYSNGKITVDVFPDNILGDDKLVVEGAQIGDIDIAVSSTTPLSAMYNDYYLFDAPYLFLNVDEVYDVGFNGETGQQIQNGVGSLGLKGISWWENGFRNLTNNSTSITEPGQLKGMKIRTMENSLHLKAWQALGANPTPMAFTELFTALQQKTVDGQENPLGLIESNKFYEVNNYISLSQHVYTPYCVLMNLDKWNSLTPEQQDIVSRAMKEATEVQLTESQAFESEAVELMEEYGCQVNALTDEQKKVFQDIIIDAGVHRLAKDGMEHPEYFEKIEEELKAYREGK